MTSSISIYKSLGQHPLLLTQKQKFSLSLLSIFSNSYFFNGDFGPVLPHRVVGDMEIPGFESFHSRVLFFFLFLPLLLLFSVILLLLLLLSRVGVCVLVVRLVLLRRTISVCLKKKVSLTRTLLEFRQETNFGGRIAIVAMITFICFSVCAYLILFHTKLHP